MFSDELNNIDWDETTQKIYSTTDNDVRRALSKAHCNVDDFMAMLSPAAEPYLETMARLSRKYTQERFGNTISMFIPLYITNSCTNSCIYCGFHRENPMARTILTLSQIEDEYKAIKKLAPFENILLVTGENPAKAGVPYIADAVELAKKYFSNIKIEVMPLSAEDYTLLTKHGLNGVICFQETYNRKNYNIYHPRGMKSRFEWRVNAFDRMGQAEVHSIGMGALIGLEKEWRTDMTMMAYHLRYLQKHYWRTKYSVNIPRMRPAQNEGFQPNCIMTDKQLAQATFAMRIFDHDVDISYSTREPAYIRDNMCTLGVTTMSAESHVNPGGYHTYPQALEQFSVNDERTAKVIDKRLRELGREPVWKDWDASFDHLKQAV
ncbi:MAG: 2-iminoacetate synthase ThiH [Bacteroidales bacterium]|nr:2-iminoacetate synthase ThiH [Bacteroidales bacterium]